MFDPSRSGKVLRKFLESERHDFEIARKDDGARRGRALIDCKDKGHTGCLALHAKSIRGPLPAFLIEARDAAHLMSFSHDLQDIAGVLGAFVHVILQQGDLMGRHPQAKLCSAPCDILSGASELVPFEPVDFSRGESCSEVDAEIRNRLRISKQTAAVRSVRVNKPPHPSVR